MRNRNYTRKLFALYLYDKDLDVLCRNVRAYINKLEEKELKSIRVKKLSAIDLRHFGWNIWNYSKPINQMDIANFLKIVFPNIFSNAPKDKWRNVSSSISSKTPSHYHSWNSNKPTAI